MAINRIQFQKGMSLRDFLNQYGDNQACEQALEQARWPDGFICPACQGNRFSQHIREGRKLWQCSGCHKQTTLQAGTVFHHSKLPLTTWFLAMYLLTQSKTNMSMLELSRHLGVRYKTAHALKHKLMEVMAQKEACRRLGGFVQVDDAYLGGEFNGGKAGRGSPNKRPFVMAVSTDEQGHPMSVVIDPVASFRKSELARWAAKRLKRGCDVYSDGLGCFKAFEYECAHTVIEGKGRKRCEAEGARWVNVVLGNFKRAIDGTYHAFDFFKYAHRYFAEFQWRFNRRFDLGTMVKQLIEQCAATKPLPIKSLRQVSMFNAELGG